MPLVTATEKPARRQKVRHQRRRRGQACRPLPQAPLGADQRYQAFQVVTCDDDAQAHRPVGVTQGDPAAAGAMRRRDAGRLRWDRAADQVAVVAGAPGSRYPSEGQRLPMDVIGLAFSRVAANVPKARRGV